MGFLSDLTALRLLDIAFFLIAIHISKKLIFRSVSYKLPPGPRPLPFVGNLFDLPKELDWVHWAKYNDIYGPISSVTVFGQTLIILNDLKAALDLFETRSTIYSNRPTLTFGGDMCGWQNTTVFLQYDEKCKAHRRFIHRLIGTPKAIERYCDLITKETHVFLNNVLQKPEDLSNQIERFAGAITLRMVYGYEISSKDTDGICDPLVELARRAGREFSDATLAGRWIVDTLPYLRHIPSWFPGAGFKTISEQYNSTRNDFTERPLAFVKQEMRSGLALKSFTADLLEMNSSDPDPWRESIVKHSAASLYIAGTDTTISTINTFFLAMMLNPSVQKKARMEIDQVVGTHRLPTIEDRPNLPYVNAILKEAMRWNPVVPLGFPHVPSQDDIYMGYFIPKGSFILPNIWLFTHDPKNYALPFEFRPERFIRSSTDSDITPEPDPLDIVFGFGRRECPGKLVADVEMFLIIASSLAVFDIIRPMDERGKPIEDKYGFDSTGLLNHPKKFKCTIMPRSKAAEELIATLDSDLFQDSGHAEKLMGLQPM